MDKTERVLEFPKKQTDVIKALLKLAIKLEKTSPEQCIAIQRDVIAMMALQCKEARYTAYAAGKALSAAGGKDVSV